ncbi:MAG TPA: T9SS type A sorting domain-containing protein, partial [Bacteroidetes bacterium]|nr:T9SS type A sorting domain-containing protein [Bacteroidota bacterium]
TVSVTGGGSPLNFMWSNGQTAPTAINLQAGQYMVVISDTNNCQDSLLITVNNIGAPTIGNTLVQHILCHGDSQGTASIVVTGGLPPYAYAWNTGDTVAAISSLSAGIYTVTVTDSNNCQTIQSLWVLEPAPLSVTVSTFAASCSSCMDGIATINPTGGTPPYSAMWSNSASSGHSVTNLVPGTYWVQVTDSNGCMVADTFIIDLGVGSTAPQASQFRLFPNPNTGVFRLIIEPGGLADIRVEIYDQIGHLAWQMDKMQVNGINEQLNMQELTVGAYLIRVVVNGVSTVRKLVIR